MSLFSDKRLDFIGEVLQDFASGLRENIHRREGKKFDFPASEHYNYSIAVFENSISIISTINILDNIPIYLKSFSPNKIYIINDITQYDYVKYHLEVYHIKLITLFDQLLLLTNTVFDLGFPAKQCTFINLLSNNHLKNSETALVLKKINKDLQIFKEIRNTIIHKGEYKDKSFHEFEIDYILCRYAKDLSVTKDYIKKLLKPILKEKISTCEKLNKIIAKDVFLFFNSLKEKYKQIYNRKS